MPIVLPVYGSRDSEIRIRPVVRALAEVGLLVPVAEPRKTATDAAALLEQHRPDVVLVHGGSTTALAGATAASERGIPVVHLDAGRCGGEVEGPLTNEPVRRLLGRIAALHLAPTEHARRVLSASAIPGERIVVTGDPLLDAVAAAGAEAVPVDERRTVIVAAHGRENRGAPMRRVGSAVRVLAARFPEQVFVLCSGPELAVHAGLTTASARPSNIVSTPVPSFSDTVRLLARSALVLTDCGELEEVAPTLDAPVLVLASTTDRPEGVLAGTSRVVGTRVEAIVEAASALLTDSAARSAMARTASPFGDGHASHRVAAAVSALLGRGERLPDFSPSEGASVAIR